MKTKQWLSILMCLGALQSAVFAIPINLSLNSQLGNVVPGHPANELDERSYVNSLVARANGVSSAPYDLAGHAYTLVNDPAAVLPFVGTLADPANYSKFEEEDVGTFNITGFRYLLVKLGNDSYVWDVYGLSGDVTLTDLPTQGGGISHRSLFRASSPIPGTPDGGMTVALLGLSLAGLGWLRRKLA